MKLADFQTRLRQSYPRFSPARQVGVSVTPQGVQIGQSGTWKFVDMDGDWSVILSPEFVGLEATRYSGRSAELRRRLREILQVTAELVAPPTREFFGLRYINHVPSSSAAPQAWRHRISPDLLGPLATDVISTDVMSSLQDIRVQQAPGIFSLKHGVRSEESGGFYLLDYDYFVEESRPFDLDEIDTLAMGFNDVIYRMFRWSITDAYFNEMASE